MTEEVMVTVSGFHTSGGEEQDNIEMVHIGKYDAQNDIQYIRYQEILEGVKQPVQNLIKIKDQCLTVRKRGPVKVDLIFEKGKSFKSTYEIPFGSFQIGLYTTSVQICSEEDRIEVIVNYVLYLNGAYSTNCDLKIQVLPKEAFRF